MSNTIDLFTRKSVEELQAIKDKDEQEFENYKKDSLQQLIDLQQDLLDEGRLDGLMFCATTTDNGFVSPMVFCPSNQGWFQMNYLADEFKDVTMNTITFGSLSEQEG
jgi:hypothetical protein